MPNSTRKRRATDPDQSSFDFDVDYRQVGSDRPHELDSVRGVVDDAANDVAYPSRAQRYLLSDQRAGSSPITFIELKL